ncbi:MAG: alpha/beta hydrolase [Deltaproteobacteria bacterium]|nr:alpha/beta hydrolase [Deltaproteobacteria bacterium]
MDKKNAWITTMSNSGLMLIIVVAFLAVLFFIFYRQIENFMVFYPEKALAGDPRKWGLAGEDVYFNSEDSVKIHGWFFPLEGDRPVILFCHGNAGNISHRLDNIRMLLNQNLQVLIFDYRGYGKSMGNPSEKGIYRDGLAAYDFLVKQKRIPPDRVVPFGRSLGAAVALEIALNRQVRSVIIEGGFTSTREMARRMPLFLPVSFLLPANYNNIKKVTLISVPILIIHGEKDNIIPFSMGQALFNSANKPKFFVPLKKAGHNDTYSTGGNQYFDFFAEFADKGRISGFSD